MLIVIISLLFIVSIIDLAVRYNPLAQVIIGNGQIDNTEEFMALLPDFPSLEKIYYEHYQLGRYNRVKFAGKINLDKIKEFCKINRFRCVEDDDWAFYRYGSPLNKNKWNLDSNKYVSMYDKPVYQIDYWGNDKYVLRIIVAKENGLFAGYLIYSYSSR